MANDMPVIDIVTRLVTSDGVPLDNSSKAAKELQGLLNAISNKSELDINVFGGKFDFSAIRKALAEVLEIALNKGTRRSDVKEVPGKIYKTVPKEFKELYEEWIKAPYKIVQELRGEYNRNVTAGKKELREMMNGMVFPAMPKNVIPKKWQILRSERDLPYVNQRPNTLYGNTKDIPDTPLISHHNLAAMRQYEANKGGIYEKMLQQSGGITGFFDDIKRSFKDMGKSFKGWKKDLTSFYKDSVKGMFSSMFKGGGLFGMVGKMFAGPWGWLALAVEVLLKVGEFVKNIIKAYGQMASQFASNALMKSIKAMIKPVQIVLKSLTSLLKTALSRSQIFQSFMQSAIIPFVVLLEYIFLPVIKTLLPFVTQFVKLISEHKNDIIAFGTILAEWLEGFLEPLLDVFKNGEFFNNPIEAVANAVAQGFSKITDWILSHKTELIKIGVDMAKAIATMLKSSFELVQIIAATLRNIILEAAQSDEVKSLVDTFKEVVITIMSSINDILLDPKVNSMISDLVLNLLGIFISTFLSAMSTMPIFGPIFGTMADIWNTTQKHGDKYIDDDDRYNYYMRQLDPGAYTTPSGNTIGNTFNNTSTVSQQFNVGLASTSFTSGNTSGVTFPGMSGYNGIGSSTI